jgi:polyphosphate kinase
VTCPIYDPELRLELKSFLDIQFKDNVKSRILDKDLLNEFVDPAGQKHVRAQWEIYKYLKNRCDNAQRISLDPEPQGERHGQPKKEPL